MTRHIFLFLFGIVLFASCEVQNSVEETEVFEISEYAVDAYVATEYASDFLNVESKLKSASKRKVKRTKEMSTPFGNKKVFVVEFEPGGFVLMSDNLLNFPVLAYSDENTWEFENFSDMAPAAKEWLMKCIRINLEIESDTVLQRLNNTRAIWERTGVGAGNLKSVDPGECIDEYVGVVENIYDNTILSSHWRQGKPFNACWVPPHRSCSGPVGCGPVAAGQIMYFWKHPNYIDWDNIDSVYADYAGDCASPIAQLMDILIDECSVHMTCDYGMVTVDNLTDGIEAMGYHADNGDYNYNLLTQSVKAGHPVIIKGADNLLSQHYWICDGYRQIQDEYMTTCFLPEGPVSHTWTTNSRAYVHLNWGWGKSSQDIWYAVNNITRPDGKPENYDSYMKLIYNIYPN